LKALRTKPIEGSTRDTEEPDFRLKKALGRLDLMVFGIGAGIFVLTLITAAEHAGGHALLVVLRDRLRAGGSLLR
jgi:APA family basic amino acid/polyamine antiporter